VALSTLTPAVTPRKAPAESQPAEAPAVRPERSRRWTTPSEIRTFTAIVGAVALVFAIVAGMSGVSVRTGFDDIGHTQEPQVVASNDLTYSLNDMDANLGNIVMVGDTSLTADVNRAAFTKLYETDRANADKDLEVAASRAGSTGQAAVQVQQALDALGAYEALAARVMLVDEQVGNRPAGSAVAAETTVFAQATDLMQKSVLPAAQGVTTTDSAGLESAYQSRHSAAGSALVWIGVIGLATVGTLLAFQALLVKRTRRLLNPSLVAATLVTVAVTVWAATAMNSGAGDLRSAKKDAYDSVAALSGAKATSTGANADETRVISDPARGQQYADAFLAKSQALVDLGPGTTLDNYDAKLKAAIDVYFGSGEAHTVSFGGDLGKELDNITFPGEREAAEAALKAYQAYELDDRVLRQKISTNVSEAIRFDTSPAPTDSDGTFVAYTNALQTVTDINQKAFDERITSGLGALGSWPWLPIGGAVAVFVLTFVGPRPRLNEYR
jgi:hypothetical protein